MAYARTLEYLQGIWESHPLKKKILDTLAPRVKSDGFGKIKAGSLNLSWHLNETETVSKYGGAFSLRLTGTLLQETWEDYNYALKYFDNDWKQLAGTKDEKPEPKKKLRETPNYILCSIIGMEFAAYPVCCGLFQANNFYYYRINGIDAEIISQLASMLTVAVRDRYSVRASRLLFVFVEHGSQRHEALFGAIDRDRTPDAFRLRSALPVPPEDEATINMTYPYLYQWAKSQAKYSEMLEYNANSGNILHIASVVLSK